jgi:hypothetical protein
MKSSEVRAFVETLLPLHGAQLLEAHGELLRVRMPAEDGGEPPPERLLAFGARAHRAHPGAELVAIGSAFLDHWIGEATAQGRFAVVYQSPPKKVRRPAAPASLPHVAGREWGEPVAASRPLFLFIYVAEYHIIDVPDDLVLLAIDPVRRERLGSGAAFLSALRKAEPQPPRGWPPLRSLPTAGDLVLSLDLLERQLQRRARRVKEASAIEIARETANIEAYYRQLISEVRAPVGRGQLAAEEEAERVRVLQLDWKRRVQEVSRFWEARGDVRISAIGVLMEPCWAFPLERRGKSRVKRVSEPLHAVANCRSGALEPLMCALCGARIGRRAGLLGEDLICAHHLTATTVPGDRRDGDMEH